MPFLLLNLLQSQTRLSWVVIAAAVVALAAGISLLVYFYKRYKRIEKETENDWDASRHSLFVNTQPPQPKTEAIDATAATEAASPVSEEATALTGVTREFAADLNLPSFAAASTAEPEPQAQPEQTSIPVQAPISAEPHPTETLTSPAIEPAVSQVAEATAPLDDDLWATLEVEPETAAEPTTTEPLTVARVEEPPRLETFEPPRIERIARGEPYEPPTIEPLTPRQVATTRELRSVQALGKDEPAAELPDERVARGTAILGSFSEKAPRPLEPHRAGPEAHEFKDELAATAPVTIPEKHVSAGVAPRSRPFGSVLGLPTEASRKPLILGEPVKPADEMGIGALTHYGKDLGPKGGRAGKIVLFIVLALLAGAALAYVFVPSVNSRVGGFIGRLRGDRNPGTRRMKTKAQIIPSSRPEVNKNMVDGAGSDRQYLRRTTDWTGGRSVFASRKRFGTGSPQSSNRSGPAATGRTRYIRVRVRRKARHGICRVHDHQAVQQRCRSKVSHASRSRSIDFSLSRAPTD